MLEELINREGLRIALAGRDDVSLEPIVKFIMRNIINPNYTELLVNVTNVILGKWIIYFKKKKKKEKKKKKKNKHYF